MTPRTHGPHALRSLLCPLLLKVPSCHYEVHTLPLPSHCPPQCPPPKSGCHCCCECPSPSPIAHGPCLGATSNSPPSRAGSCQSTLIEAIGVPDRWPITAGYAPTRCSCHPRGPRKVLRRFIDSPHSI
ncbi:hypothetical protein F5Y13DRAFT_168452 [Hypoxylon sp. FL1857]|nr:hypothetical protein F5Y13DRAFT_168452 [Hypoxylon sp. FL1857]